MVKLPHAILLVNLQMTERVIGHTPQPLLITPDPQGNLLGHRSAWEEYGGIFAQIRRHLILEVFYNLTRTIHITLQVPIDMGECLFQDLSVSYAMPWHRIGRLRKGFC
ncbi:hypothetical protein D3C72_1257810 [compost metagenome]